MLAYDGRSFGKLREVFGILWDAALLPRTSTGLEYSDSIGGCGVTVRVRKGDRIHFWEGFEEPLRPSFVSTSEGVREAVNVISISMGGIGERSSTLRRGDWRVRGGRG